MDIFTMSAAGMLLGLSFIPEPGITHHGSAGPVILLWSPLQGLHRAGKRTARGSPSQLHSARARSASAAD